MHRLTTTNQKCLMLLVLLFLSTGYSIWAKDNRNYNLALSGGAIQIAPINAESINFSFNYDVLIESISEASGAVQGVVYSWEKTKDISTNSWSVIDNSNSISLDDGQIFHTTYYRRKATDGVGNEAYSNTVAFYKLEIFSHPSTAQQVVSIGGEIQPLTVTHSIVGGTPVYQWYVNTNNSNENGTPISGANSSTYTPDNSIKNWGYYYVVITDQVSVTSNPSGEVFVGNSTTTIPQIDSNDLPQYSSQAWFTLLTGDNFDPANDVLHDETDLVGNAANPMLQTQRDRFLISESTSPEFVYYFRARHGTVPNNNGLLKSSFYLGIDVDGDKTADLFVEANTKNNGIEGVYLHLPDPSGDGLSPSTTSWQNAYVEPVDQEYMLTTYRTFIGDYTTDEDLDNQSGGDAWLEFAISESALSEFVQQTLSINITGDSVITLYVFTSTNQIANGDIAGVNDQTADLSQSWEELGITVTSSVNELIELITPTINGGTFSTTTVFLTGTWGGSQGGTDSLAIELNGQTYVENDSQLSININQWVLEIDSTMVEAGMSYTVTATATRSTETKTATDTIRILDDNADLALLETSENTFSLTISQTQEYQTLVDADQNQTILTAVTSSSLASVTINGEPYSSGSSLTLNLNTGENTFHIDVVAENQIDTSSYLVTILRGYLPLVSQIDPSTDEDGDQGSFSVVLPAQPTGDVTINLSVSDDSEAVIDKTVLVFTNENWNIPQIVTATGIDDPISEGDSVRDGAQAYQITGVVSSTDILYDNGDLPTVSMTNQDTDPPGIYISIDQNETSESGGSITISIRLLSTLLDNNAELTLPLSLSDETEGSFSPSQQLTTTIVLLSNNQLSTTLVIYGVNDFIDDGNISYNLISGDPQVEGDVGYNNLTAEDVADFELINLDDDPTVTHLSYFQDITVYIDQADFFINIDPDKIITNNTDGEFSYSISSPSIASVGESTGLVSILAVGEAIITASQASSTNYTEASITATLTVLPLENNLFWANDQSVLFGSSSFTVPVEQTLSSGSLSYSSSNESVAIIDEVTGQITPLSVGLTTLTVIQSSDGIYAESSDSFILSVTQQAPLITVEDLIKEYGDQAFDLSTIGISSTSDGAYSFSSSNSEILSIEGSIATIHSAGTVVISLVQEATSNYASATSSFTIVINKIAPQLVPPTDMVFVYGDSDSTLLLQSSSNGDLSFTYSNSTVANVVSYEMITNGAELLIKPLEVGQTTISINQAESTNYLAATTSFVVTVQKANPIIVFEDLELTYGDAAFTLNYSSTSPGAVSFVSIDENIAQMNINEVSAINAGSVLIELSQESTANYNAATTSMTLTVHQKSIVASEIKALDKIYDGTTSAEVDLASVLFEGLINGDEVTIAVSAQFETLNVGTDLKVNLSSSYSGSDVDNYIITDQLKATASILPKEISIQGAINVIKTYDGTDRVISETAYQVNENFIPGDDVFVIGLARYDTASAGERKIVQGTIDLSGSNSANYSIDWTDGSGLINPSPLQISVLDDSKFVTQNDPNGYNGVVYQGFVNGESKEVLSGTLVITRTNLENNTTGLYQSVLKASGLSSSNYEISFVNGDFSIIPADELLIDIDSQIITYSETPSFNLSGSYYSSVLSEVIILDPPIYNNSTGVYTLNDGVGGSVSFELKIASSALTILSSSGNTMVGAYSMETANTQINSTSFTGGITTLGALTIIPKIVTPSIIQPIKNYDGNRIIKTDGIVLDGLVENDVVGALFEGLYDTSNAAVDKSYQISGIQLEGIDQYNYQLSSNQLNGIDGVINPIELSIIAQDVVKVYDGAINENYPLVFNGFIEGEDEYNLSGDLVVNEPAHSASSVGVYPFNISGYSSSNYSIIYTGAQLDIKAAELFISGFKSKDKIYDGLLTTTVDQTNLIFDGLIEGDEVLVSSTALFDNPNVGVDKATQLEHFFEGVDASNYSITAQSTSTATINKAPLQVIADHIIVQYTGAVFENFTVSYQGFVNGESTEQLTGSLSFNGAAIDAISGGDYSIEVSGLEAENYELSFQEGILTIVEGDIDGDGIVDSLDSDIDGDGVPNEGDSDINGDGVMDNGPDFDLDGMNDSYDTDDDNDLLSDNQEINYNTDPFNPDSDFDGVVDGTEVADNTNPLIGCDLDWEHRTIEVYNDSWLALDCDEDGLINAVEIDLDTDEDGILDIFDEDDDGDTLLTRDEGADPNQNGLNDDSLDFDFNGIPDYLEKNKLDPNALVARDIEVFNAMSPNSDGDNDYFIIRNIENYPDNELFIMNKDGDLVQAFEAYGKNGLYFYGLDQKGEVLPVGIYYYVLKVRQYSLERVIKGYLYINW